MIISTNIVLTFDKDKVIVHCSTRVVTVIGEGGEGGSTHICGNQSL